MSVFYIFRHPFDYQIMYLINTSSTSNSTSVDKLIHHIMEFILASLEPPASFSRVSGSEFAKIHVLKVDLHHFQPAS